MPFGYVPEYSTVEIQNLRNMPQGEPSNGDSISWDDATGKWLYQTIGAGGDVTGPNLSYDQAIVRFDGTTGKIIRNSDVYISDNNDLTNVNQFQLRGTLAGRMTMQAADYTLIDYTVTMPNAQGAASTFLRNDGTGALSWVTAGNVVGPASATNHVVATFDGTTGKLLKGVPVAMDSAGAITGVTTMTVSNTVTGLVAPVNASDAANKNYVDAAISGLKWKAPVLAASTVNLAAISGLLTVDGVVLVAGNRVLLVAQTDGVQNGIYVVAAGAWARSSDFAVGASANGVSVFVTSGTTETGTAYTCINTTASFAYYGAPVGDIVGTDALVFHVFAFNPSGGNVVGPASATSNAVTRFDSTTGKLVKNSAVTISDTADIAGAKTLVLSGSSSGAITLRAAASGATFNLTLPSSVGVVNTFLRDSDGAGTLAFGSAVTNAGVSTDNALARFDATTGQIIQNSALTVSDTADLAGVKTLAMTGSASGTLTVRPAATTTAYTMTLPGAVGASGTVLKASDGAGTLAWGTSGDVSGPSSSTSNAVSRFDLTTGKILKNSAITISDTADLAGVKTLAMTGSTSGVIVVQPAAITTAQTLTLPGTVGTAGTFLNASNGTGTLAWANAVTNAGASTDNALARFDATTGQIIQDSLVTVSDTADLAGVKTLAMSGSVAGVLTVQPAASTNTHTLTMPDTVGAQGTYLKASNASGTLTWATAGDLAGPSSATANAITRFDSTTGKLVKNSALTISDVAGLAGVKTLAMSGSASGTLTVQPAATTVDYTLTMPAGVGVSGTYLKASDGAGTLTWAPGGDLVGPNSATANAITRFDTTTGKLVKNSAVTISDTADIAGATTLAMTGAATGVLTMKPKSATITHTLTMPGTVGAQGTVLKASDGAGVLEWGTAGDMYGPASATGNAIVRFDSTTGKLVKNSGITISDVAGIGGVKQLSMTGSSSGSLILQPKAVTVDHTLTMPGTVGPQGTFLKAADGAGVLEWGMAGDVLGPISSANNQLARFDGTTGKYVKTCPIVVSDTGEVSLVKTLAMNGSTSGASTLKAAAVTTDHTLTLPANVGAAGTFLKAADSSGTLTWGTTTGDVVGPSVAVNFAVALFDGTTGKVIRNSAMVIDTAGAVTGVTTLTVSGQVKGVAAPAVATDAANKTYVDNAILGYVTGPVSSTNNQLARFDLTTGKLIKTSALTVSDTADLAGVKTIAMSGSTSGTFTMQAAATTTSYTVKMPSSQGTNGLYLRNDGAGNLSWSRKNLNRTTLVEYAGDLMSGPTTATQKAIPRFSDTTGESVDDTSVLVTDANGLSGLTSVSMNGSVSGTITIQPPANVTTHTLTLPAASGANGTFLQNSGGGVLTWTPGAGDVSGPAAASDNALARFDATTGKLLQTSQLIVSDAGDIVGASTLAFSGSTSGVFTMQTSGVTTTYGVTMPAAQGVINSVLTNDGSGVLSWTPRNVVGFSSITTTAQTGLITDNFVLFTPPTSTSLAYTLPSPSVTSGVVIKYQISKSATALNSTVTLSAPSGKTVNGAATFILACVGDFVVLMSNGNDWVVSDKPTGRLLISNQTFTGATAVTFDSVFAASKYTSYSFDMSLVSTAAAPSVNTWRLRSGGASITTANYSCFTRYIGAGGFNQGDAITNNNETSWGGSAYIFNFATNGDQLSISGEIANPASTALFKRISLTGAYTSNGATFSEFASGQYRVAATTADGFVYTSATASALTGYAKIYAVCE